MAFQSLAHALLVTLVAALTWPRASCLRKGKQVAEQSASADASVAGSRRRRRRSCGEWNDVPPTSEQSVGCTSSSPGACDAPQAFTIRRLEGSQTRLGTYPDISAARNVYNEGAQFRLLLDGTQNVVEEDNNCGNREAYLDQARTWLTEMTECKYPWGGWVMIFAEINPRASYMYEEEVAIGRSFTQTNSTSIDVSYKTSVGFGPFRSSSSFRYIYETSSSLTWEKQTKITKRWNIQAGTSVVAWKYVLRTKCFNTAGQFLDEATFETNIQMQTGDTNLPACDPNVPGQCAGLGYS